MNIQCADLASMVGNLPLVRECDRVRSGALRLSTPFFYPNGESIDVFLDSDKQLLQDDFVFSDYGQTALYLRQAAVSFDATSRKREVVGDILGMSGVKFNSNSELTSRPTSFSPSALSDAILRLAQACVRISDLATHQRLRSLNPFRDDVEDFFDANHLRWTPNVKLPAVFGERTLRMDFEVSNGNKSSYVNVLGALNDAAAHASANEITIKWLDLIRSGERFMQKFVTVYNSQSTVLRIEDLERLSEVSSLVSYPQQSETLVDVLSDRELA